MTLTPRNVFKAAFLKQCRAEGLTDGQVAERATKLAALLEKQGGPFLDAVHSYLNNAMGKIHQGYTAASPEDQAKPHVAALTVGLPATALVGGIGAGALTSHLKGNYRDEDDVKNQEVIDELRRQTLLAKQHKRMV